MTKSTKSLPALLAIDASSSICSLALQVNDTIDSLIIDESRLQAVKLIPALEELLQRNNMSLSNIDAFVLSNGPGRFTGLRIAVGFIQGLAYSSDKKIITINSLELQAEQFIVQNKPIKNKIWVCNKAYNNVYYTSKYQVGNLVLPIEHTAAKNKAELIEELNNNDLSEFNFIGTGFSELFADLGVQDQYQVDETPPHAQYIFGLANLKFINNDFVDVYSALPDYAVNPYK